MLSSALCKAFGLGVSYGHEDDEEEEDGDDHGDHGDHDGRDDRDDGDGDGHGDDVHCFFWEGP